MSLDKLGGGAHACILDSALQAELTACLWATEMDVWRGYSSFLLYTDCAMLVRLLYGLS